jgi:SRSO17 transposase
MREELLSGTLGPSFSRWLEPFLEAFGHKVRSKWAPVYLRGLLMPGERKSVEPLAARIAPGDVEQLHHFVATSRWDTEPIEAVLLDKADALLGGDDAHLIVDDTAIPKKGEHSVGVAHQYCGQLGKQANCQCLVSVALARGDVPVPVALRLFVPESWAEDRGRCRRAGIPDTVTHRPKWQIAIEEIRRIREAGVRFGDVLADAGYGACAQFRHELSAMGLRWAVGISSEQLVYPMTVRLRFPRASTGRPRKHGVPTVARRSVRDAIADLGDDAFRTIRWRRGTKGWLSAEFAAVRVRIADGPVASRHVHLPGEEAWLICERRRNGDIKYHLTNHSEHTPLRTIAATIKARWSCEQVHQQLKEELGLTHFEGRSWHGLHHHTLLTMIAFAFLQTLRVRQNKA